MSKKLFLFRSYAIDIYDNILGEDEVHLLRFNSKKG